MLLALILCDRHGTCMLPLRFQHVLCMQMIYWMRIMHPTLTRC